MDTGLRAGEARSLPHKDIELMRKDGAIESGRVIVSKSKTEAGTGRVIPLTRRACAVLTLWLARFPEATPQSFVFPRHRIACRVDKFEHHLYDVDLSKPIRSWKRAWKYASVEKAKVACRWHDLRHTFISRLAESPNVSGETISAHSRVTFRSRCCRDTPTFVLARKSAIAALEGLQAPRERSKKHKPGSARSQKWSQPAPERLN
jgi:integrase